MSSFYGKRTMRRSRWTSNASEELADVFAYAIMLAGRHGLDVSEIVKEKIEQNSKKYPVDQAKGNSAKYRELKG